MSTYIDDFLSIFQIDKSSSFEIKYTEEEVKKYECRVYKPDRKIIDFLTPLEVKRFKVAKLLSKHMNKCNELDFRLKTLKNKPLPEELCDYFIEFFKKKGVKL